MRVLQSLQSWAISDVACGDTTDDCNMMCATGGGRQQLGQAYAVSVVRLTSTRIDVPLGWNAVDFERFMYVRIADSCQKWAARRDSGKQSVSAVCICSSSSSICKHYNDPTTSGPDGIISTGVANFCSSARRNGTRAWLTEQLLRCPMPFYLAPAPVLVVGCAVPLKPSACINWNSNLRTKSQNVSGR